MPKNKPPTSPVFAVAHSENRKLGGLAATGSAQVTCPTTCPHRSNGCYAETGHAGIQTHRLASVNATADETIAAHVAAIDKLPADRGLRLNVVGDFPTREHVQAVAGAARRYTEKHGEGVFGFTHNHEIMPEDCAGISLLRSCETPEQVTQAANEGMPAAMVISDRPDKPTLRDLVPGMTGIICPNQWTEGKITCATCPNFCRAGEGMLARNVFVVFYGHGPGAKKLRGHVTKTPSYPA